jgi:uncharacterized membrane protein YkvI
LLALAQLAPLGTLLEPSFHHWSQCGVCIRSYCITLRQIVSLHNAAKRHCHNIQPQVGQILKASESKWISGTAMFLMFLCAVFKFAHTEFAEAWQHVPKNTWIGSRNCVAFPQFSTLPQRLR